MWGVVGHRCHLPNGHDGMHECDGEHDYLCDAWSNYRGRWDW